MPWLSVPEGLSFGTVRGRPARGSESDRIPKRESAAIREDVRGVVARRCGGRASRRRREMTSDRGTCRTPRHHPTLYSGQEVRYAHVEWMGT